MSSSVDMKHEAPEYIQVKYYTACQGPSTEIKESSECDELVIGKEVQFSVQIKVLKCPVDSKDWKQTFKISPVGSQEAIYVNLEMNCDCACEHPEHHVSNTYF
jgi:protocadherin alpha